MIHPELITVSIASGPDAFHQPKIRLVDHRHQNPVRMNR